MNKRNFFILGLSAMLFAASCKKQDVVPAENTKDVVQSEWKTMGNWTSSKEDGYTAYNNSIDDKAITAEVVENGMILVFIRDGNKVESMPYQQTGKNEAYWHYQVSENNIQLNADVSGARSLDKLQSFIYFIISPDKLKALEAQGHSQDELMTFTYDKASTLLK